MSAAPNLRITGNGVTVGFGLLGDAQATRSGAATGGGGWQIVDRPRAKTATEWVDVGQWQLTMNLRLDGLFDSPTPASVEAQVAAVEAWEAAAPGSSPPEPPRLRVAGPVPHTDLSWVIYNLTWGAAIRNPATGMRWQQDLSVVLWEYSSPSLTLGPSPAQAAAAGTSSAARTYRVVSGDTLTAIAARLLGSASRWTQIANLNGIRDPRSIRPGQLLKIPAR